MAKGCIDARAVAQRRMARGRSGDGWGWPSRRDKIAGINTENLRGGDLLVTCKEKQCSEAQSIRRNSLKSFKKIGGRSRTRTYDPLIKSPVL